MSAVHEWQTDASTRANEPQRGEDISRPKIDIARLREVKVKDYAIRFALGGVVSVAAALIGVWTAPRLGGVFTAFPAILLASLTLIGEKHGREQSAEDAEGGTLGAIAFVLVAAFIAATITHLAGAVSLLLALGLWLAFAVGLYGFCVRVGLLRTYKADQEHGDRSGSSGSSGSNGGAH